MSLAYIRDYYRVPAKRGMRVVADGKPGRITGSDDASLRILIDGDKRSTRWHPTWNMRYPTDAVVPPARPRVRRRHRRMVTVAVPGVSY